LLRLTDWVRRYEIWIAEEMAVAWRVLGLAISEQPERFIRRLENQSVPNV